MRYSHSSANAKFLRRASGERAPRGFRRSTELIFASQKVRSRAALYRKKQEGCCCIPLVFCGGESEIRTHGTVLAFTRFPVVRLRPAQPSLHIDSTIIPQENIKIKSFLKKFFIFSQFLLKSALLLFSDWLFLGFQPSFSLLSSVSQSSFRPYNRLPPSDFSL